MGPKRWAEWLAFMDARGLEWGKPLSDSPPDAPVMSPREKLLRLALAMPEAAIPTICRSIAWICPGIDDPKMPAMVRQRAELLEELDSIIHDPVLRKQFVEVVERLKAEHVPSPPRDNVVSLFSETVG